jgi:hypothetical protein
MIISKITNYCLIHRGITKSLKSEEKLKQSLTNFRDSEDDHRYMQFMFMWLIIPEYI